MTPGKGFDWSKFKIFILFENLPKERKIKNFYVHYVNKLNINQQEKVNIITRNMDAKRHLSLVT